MRHAFATRLVECVGDLCAIFEGLLQRQRTAAQSRGQRFAFHIFYHQKIQAVVVTDVVDLADVGG